MSELIGDGVHDRNLQFRLLMIGSMGVLAFGAVMYWRTQLDLTSGYQPLPVTHQQIKIIDQNRAEQKAISDLENN